MLLYGMRRDGAEELSIHCTWLEDQGVWPPKHAGHLQPTPQLNLEVCTLSCSHRPVKKTPDVTRINKHNQILSGSRSKGVHGQCRAVR